MKISALTAAFAFTAAFGLSVAGAEARGGGGGGGNRGGGMSMNNQSGGNHGSGHAGMGNHGSGNLGPGHSGGSNSAMGHGGRSGGIINAGPWNGGGRTINPGGFHKAEGRAVTGHPQALTRGGGRITPDVPRHRHVATHYRRTKSDCIYHGAHIYPVANGYWMQERTHCGETYPGNGAMGPSPNLFR